MLAQIKLITPAIHGLSLPANTYSATPVMVTGNAVQGAPIYGYSAADLIFAIIIALTVGFIVHELLAPKDSAATR